MMQDIAISTGGQFITEDIGLSMETSEVDVLGLAKKVIIDKDDTIILGGGGSQEDLKARVDQISQEVQECTSQYDIEKL